MSAKWRTNPNTNLLVLLGLTIFLLWYFGAFNPRTLAKLPNVTAFLANAFPPDPRPTPLLLLSMLETVLIALAGTVIAVLISVPLASMSTRSLFSTPVTTFFRLLLSVIRTVPSILWALLFVITVGLGPLAGVLGTAMYSIGYLGKLLYEAFDVVDREVLDSVRMSGAGKIALMRYVVIPESANYIISQSIFMFEYNVRASTILGLVGAGGIGFYILSYVQVLDYRSLTTTLLIVLAFVVIFDLISSRLRSRFLPA
ncbi:MAG: phosphonate ABC transporter, permease protein PhnE [Thaumarchaeota archaeon]|nr:phosphonate ABC transporter, permease protein PhnE [Candidatus Calditenuaceae archaeon]MDW8187638.1 phosphonate ABC transporter, permease protein PhnE [Nitrososphaerota archaeon]